MKTYFYFIKSLSFLSILFLLTTFSCKTFQGVSYYSSDGIYGDSYFSETKKKPSESGRKNIYYKDYFGNLADDYSSLNQNQTETFTDSDNYTSQNSGKKAVNSHAPWGDRPSSTEIYNLNYNPWGIFNNGWLFNRGYFNSFFDPFWGGYYGLAYRNFYNPWGLGFYSPFYGYGFPLNVYGFPFRSRFFYGGYPLNRYNMGYSYSGFSRGNYVNSRSNTSRGGRSSQAVSNYNYTNQNRTYSNNNIQTSDSKNRRYNVGRKSDNGNNSNDNVSASRSSNQRTTSSRGSNNINNYIRRSYENRSGSSNNYGTSRYSNYSSGRSYSSSQSYSSGSRSSSSSSRGSSSRGR